MYAKENLVLIMTIKKCHKVRDYFHYTGKYKRTAHKICS